ncbi:MAG: peptidylprolyl isomerase [Polyangiaceae bacterium]|nr:peptidylprolyl isomerase [Polyangiaceae bacterium]
MNRSHFACFFPLLLVACEEPPPEPEPPARAAPKPAATPVASGAIDLGGRAAATATAAVRPAPIPSVRKISAKPVAEVKPSEDDPLKGKFTLADATGGLTGKGPLVAEIKTDKGTLSCTLFEDKAPITVANFVGLARGLRPWKTPAGKWEKKPGYDGTTFHRVVKGFMIQGGDPAGSGAGEPGYVIPDEVWEDAHHDQRGLLCMANRGPNTNGMQFFVMDGVAAHLDGGYTIFGKCEPESVIEALATVPVQGERAVTPPKIQKVTVKRLAKPAAPTGAPSAPGAPSAAPRPAPAPSAK